MKKELNKIYNELKIDNEIKRVKIINIDLMEISLNLYEKGYSGLDIIEILENYDFFPNLIIEKRYKLLFEFNKIRKEFRNEKILIMYMLNNLFVE